MSFSPEDDYAAYQGYVAALYEQYLRRETWCAVSGAIPDKQRRHFPEKFKDQVVLQPGFGRQPYLCYDRNRAVFFPGTRRLFPLKKQFSNLQGFF